MQVQSRADMIHYFISHSWEDDPAKKCKALRTFVDEHSGTLSGPSRLSFWLDKVRPLCFVAKSEGANPRALIGRDCDLSQTCIDQANPGNALSVLPINVSSCKSMLVLMSSTYLKRLW
jgi:hypothetical protein